MKCYGTPDSTILQIIIAAIFIIILKRHPTCEVVAKCKKGVKM